MVLILYNCFTVLLATLAVVVSLHDIDDIPDSIPFAVPICVIGNLFYILSMLSLNIAAGVDVGMLGYGSAVFVFAVVTMTLVTSILMLLYNKLAKLLTKIYIKEGVA